MPDAEAPIDWNALDTPDRIAGLRVLRARLAADPGDADTRAVLIGAYRALGDQAQAGRFALAVPGEATLQEFQAYASLVRGLRGGVHRTRRLSCLPEGQQVPEEFLEEVGNPGRDAAEDSFTAAALAWAGFVLVWPFIALIVLLVSVLTGHGDLPGIVRWWGLGWLWVLVLALAVTAVSCFVARSWRAGLVWLAVAVAAACGTVALTLR